MTNMGAEPLKLVWETSGHVAVIKDFMKMLPTVVFIICYIALCNWSFDSLALFP